MKNYGIELEFFVKDAQGIIVPAYKHTYDTDGNPVIGEIKTKVHSNIVDCVFELQKLLFLQQKKLNEKECVLDLASSAKVDKNFLLELRKDSAYINRKRLEQLEELSIYTNGKLGKMLPRGLYKASLQINISDNSKVYYKDYDKNKKTAVDKETSYGQAFNYLKVIKQLDDAFAQEISEAGRVKGVYSIKGGELGNRIEYRSLPNTVSLDKIIEVLS